MPPASSSSAAKLTTNSDGDASQVGPLLEQTSGPIDTVLADRAYDGEPIYQTIAARNAGARVVIPPRAMAVPSGIADTTPTRQDRHIESLAEHERRSGFCNALAPRFDRRNQQRNRGCKP